MAFLFCGFLSGLLVFRAVVRSFNRVYTVVDYADEAARLTLADNEWHFLCVVNGVDVNKVHSLFDAARQHCLSVGRVLFAESVGVTLPEAPNGRSTLLMELVSLSSNPHMGAFERAVQSAFHGAEVITTSPGEIERVLASAGMPAVSEAFTLCLVKPHILRQGKTAALLRSIVEVPEKGVVWNIALFLTHSGSVGVQRGFDIVGLQKIHLNGSMAESFFSVYKVRRHFCVYNFLYRLRLTHFPSGNHWKLWRTYCTSMRGTMSCGDVNERG